MAQVAPGYLQLLAFSASEPGRPFPPSLKRLGGHQQALAQTAEASGKPAVNVKKRPALGDRTNTAQGSHGWPRAKVRAFKRWRGPGWSRTRVPRRSPARTLRPGSPGFASVAVAAACGSPASSTEQHFHQNVKGGKKGSFGGSPAGLKGCAWDRPRTPATLPASSRTPGVFSRPPAGWGDRDRGGGEGAGGQEARWGACQTANACGERFRPCEGPAGCSGSTLG